MIEQTITKTITCKNCNSKAVVKFGTYKGVQRYFCKECNRKFKADADAFHMKVPLEQVSRALSEFYSGMSVNDIRNILKQEYGYYPSKSVVYKWIVKYTDIAVKKFADYHPKVSSTWVADETMVDIDGERKVWVYNVIDEATRFLLASRVAIARTTKDAALVMKQAEKRAGTTPKKVLTDANKSYDDGIELAFGSKAEHIQTKPFAHGDNTQRIERYHGIFKDRSKVMRAFRDVETLIQFNDGFLVYYNFFKPHISLNGKTPAEQGGIDYQVKNWADLAREPVSKQSEVQSHSSPKPTAPKAKISTEHAFRRHRIRITQRPPRVTPPIPKISDTRR